MSLDLCSPIEVHTFLGPPSDGSLLGMAPVHRALIKNVEDVDPL